MSLPSWVIFGAAVLGITFLMVIVAVFISSGNTKRMREQGLWPPAGQKLTTADVQRLIDAGNKIEAIKMYRELTGMGLKESKDAVEAMAGGR